MKNEREPPSRKKVGAFGRLAHLMLGLAFWLVASLFFSILIEWAGMATIWREEGSQHAQQTFRQDQHFFEADVVSRQDPLAVWAENINRKTSACVQKRFFSRGFSPTSTTTNSPWEQDVDAFLDHYFRWDFSEYRKAVPYIVQGFVLKCSLLTLCLPIFLLMTMVGLVDGLVERDLRRWGGGRESSLAFNLARSGIAPAFVLGVVVYLSVPVSIHPALILTPCAIAMACFVRIACERLKKYF